MHMMLLIFTRKASTVEEGGLRFVMKIVLKKKVAFFVATMKRPHQKQARATALIALSHTKNSRKK